MPKQAYIFELSEQSFAKSAIENSYQLPVLVEFMGVWSGPCVQMADLLANLASEFPGQFIFAKVDIDEQPGLREQFKVAQIPTLVVLQQGAETQREAGQLQEVEVRGLLKDLGIFRESDELRKKARENHLAGDTQGAILLLTQAIQSDPSNTRVAMDMVQIFLDMGEFNQAGGLFDRLPDADRESAMGKALSGQLLFARLAENTEGLEQLQQRLIETDNDYAAHFDLALCLVVQHRYDDAMQHLFQILQNSPDFRDGAAREMIITLSNMLASTDPEAAQIYRRRLNNLMAE